MLSGARPRLLGAAHPRPARVCVVLQPSAASSQLAWSNANSTAPGLLPAATDVTYVLGQYRRGLDDKPAPPTMQAQSTRERVALWKCPASRNRGHSLNTRGGLPPAKLAASRPPHKLTR